jgi:acetyl-CoA C-acetyltransferase
MSLDPATPVIVGVGQVTNPPEAAGQDTLDGRPEPVGLMVEAVRAAIEDCDGTEPGGTAPRGHRLVGRAQSLRVANPLSWHYLNPGLPVADKLGMTPAEIVVTTTGGNNPQSLVNATALAIGRGELDVAVLVGADCVYSRVLARRHPDRPVLPWSVQPVDTERAEVFGNDRRGTTDAEEERGLDLPIHVYPLFENALRAEAGRSLDEHRGELGALWSRFSEVASGNPHAWLRTPRTAEEIATVSDTNRMIAYPYTKLLTANMQVDQGAALIMCSAAAAQAVGIPRSRWVFPRSGADADDHWFLSHRHDFHSSPAIRVAGASALALAGTTIDEIAHLDLYSCFPSAVQIAAAELGLPLDDPQRPLTVTGGLTFAGGPGNNYGTHAVATMVSTLRRDPGSLGLVTGVGWYLTEHSVGIYATEPWSDRGSSPRGSGLPSGITTEEAGGFVRANPQSLVNEVPQCSPDADAEGEVTVETYSVSYGRGGAVERGVVACRTSDGRRAWANITDPDQLSVLVSEEGCGRSGALRPDGAVDLD